MNPPRAVTDDRLARGGWLIANGYHALKAATAFVLESCPGGQGRAND